ncbi:MAG: hypothetical protein ACT4P7_14630 [Gemmatimonadaceae bacterium]
MKGRPKRFPVGRRGVALVLVLWIVVILGALGAAVTGAARTSAGLAANARAGAVARSAAESGIEATISDIEQGLASVTDSVSRAAFLNALEGSPRDSVALGQGRVAVAISDPSARLDVNAAPAANLAMLLSHFTDGARASETARAIRAFIERAATPRDARLTALSNESPRFVTPLRSLEELRRIPAVDLAAVEQAAPYLTIDGDGTVNRRTASDTVLAAAFGEERDEPSRLLIVARGWQFGSLLTHEVQAVFAVSGISLVLIHWRERQL